MTSPPSSDQAPSPKSPASSSFPSTSPLASLASLADALPPQADTATDARSPTAGTGMSPTALYDFSREESPEDVAVKRYKESLRAYTAARFSEFKVEAETRSRLSPAPKAASRGATPVRDTV